jgi:hypothetical protein
MHCPVFDQYASTHVPKRLIEIISEQGRLYLQLKETVPTEPLQYACLSYCWGGPQPVTTTKATLHQRMKGIGFASLPKTLQDVVAVTHELGLSLIWIDCLCIVQVRLSPEGHIVYQEALYD